MNTNSKNLYEAPATTVVEAKLDTGILISSPMWVILGTESGSTPATDYGVQDYGSGGSYNW